MMTKDNITRAIEDYNSIFQYDNLNMNLVVCEQPLLSLKCLSLDNAELCAYIIIQKIKNNSIDYAEIQWHWKEVGGKYIFFVLPNPDEQRELQGVIRTCPQEKYKSLMPSDNYVGLIDEIEVYGSCMMEGSKENHSCPLETDLLLAINRNGRDLADLNLLNQILCCLDLNLTISFLDAMSEELKERGSKAEQKAMWKGIKQFVDGVEDLCKEIAGFFNKSCVDDCNKCRLPKVVETCEITADIFRRKQQMKQQPINLNSIYTNKNTPHEKVQTFFASAKEWNRDKKVRHRSCNSILETMRKSK